MFAVIMAGGSGTRFWPASRERLPKQFLKITGECTLFEETIRRIQPLVEESHIYVVVNRNHADLTRRYLAGSRAKMLVEPAARNTAACIGLAALHVSRRGPNQPMIACPSDHFIGDNDCFLSALRTAAELARSGAIVTIGIQPERPETGYGYIEMGSESGCILGRSYNRIERFVEKPDRQTATRYLAEGRHLWNSGIFVFTAETILREIEEHLPALYHGLQEIGNSIGSIRHQDVVEQVYGTLIPISIDYGIMEQTRAVVYAIRADFSWSDVGTWRALYDLRSRDKDEHRNVLLGDAIATHAQRNLVYSSTNRLVALLGVEDLLVVDTPDALLVGHLEHSQDVRCLHERLRRDGRTEVC